MRNLEQELKLSLDRRQYDLLRQQADTLPTLQTNHYFWSDGMSENEMVRLRERDGVFVLCYKKRISNTDGITVSDEREMEIAPDFANKMIQQGISFETLKSTVGVNYENNLTYVGKLDTYRTKFMLEDWCIELDQNAYFDQVAEMFSIFPDIIRTIFAENCVAVVFLAAIVMNLIMPKDSDA